MQEPTVTHPMSEDRSKRENMSVIASRELTLSWRTVWLCWVLVIVVVTTYPWAGSLGDARWDRVIWVPFHNMRVSLDAVANIALYLPFGFSFVQSRLRVHKGDVVLVSILAALLSVSCEFYQVFHPSRFPSMTDVASNTLGGIIGVLIAGKLPVSRLVIDK